MRISVFWREVEGRWVREVEREERWVFFLVVVGIWEVIGLFWRRWMGGEWLLRTRCGMNDCADAAWNE